MAKKKKVVEPEPVDTKRCQGEHFPGSFMTMGPRKWMRCRNKPTYIAYENKLGKDGAQGSMSLCDNCKKIFRGINGKNVASFIKINS